MQRKDEKAGATREGFALTLRPANFGDAWEKGQNVARVAVGVQELNGFSNLEV
jgi:hypothetical protein